MLRLSTFPSDVLGVVLSGLSTATNAAIAATDSVLVALGKLQAQLANYATVANPTFSGTVTIPGGSINNATIGATTPSTGAFTSLSASSGATVTGGVTTGTFYSDINWGLLIRGKSSNAAADLGLCDAAGSVRLQVQSGGLVQINNGLTVSGTTTLAAMTSTGITSSPISGSTGAFTTLSASGVLTANGSLVVASGGASFGSQTGASNTDLSEHIALYGTTYGFNVTGSSLNYIVPTGAAHYLTVAGTTMLKVSAGGGAVYNAFSISPASNDADLILNGPSGNSAWVFTRTAGSNRWSFGRNNSTESGSNAGSDFLVTRYADAGTAIDNPLAITRSTGLVTVNTLSAGGGGFAVDSSGNATALSYIVGASGPTVTSGSAAPTATQPSGSIYLRTSGSTGARLYVTSGGGTWAAVSGV